ncbi:RNA-directed DNA polymerase, eukaryota, reverse transcriptase zinc-binding domain protein, partial [Tanacetum coccineum]
DSLAYLKLSLGSSIYRVWKLVDTPYRAMWDTAYWGFLRVRTTFDIFQNLRTDTPYLLDRYDVLRRLKLKTSIGLASTLHGFKADKTLTECEAVSDEEKFLFQQAKIDCLKDGDRNTKFFHAYLKSRRNISRITMIKNKKGESFINEKVPEQFVMHFKEFLGTSQPTQLDLLDKIDFDKLVSHTDAEWMLRPVSNEEIKQAMFDINDNRAPGPDGFSSKFYKKAWDIIGNDVCAAVKEFFNKGKLIGELNAIVISLIPKLETHTKVSDFRPIACCNAVYKSISKVLTERIKKALCYLVDPNQSAFLPGRQITDNIMLTQELLRGYDWKNGAQRVSFKIDLQKAHDTINWDFLKAVMTKFQFPSKMIITSLLALKPNPKLDVFDTRNKPLLSMKSIGEPWNPRLSVRQKAMMDLAVQFDNASAAKQDLRQAYEKCNDIPQETRNLIDAFLKRESDKDYEINLAMYRKAGKIEKQIEAKYDEEVLRETLEEQARSEKEWEDRIKKEEAEGELFILEFGVHEFECKLIGIRIRLII